MERDDSVNLKIKDGVWESTQYNNLSMHAIVLNIPFPTKKNYAIAVYQIKMELNGSFFTCEFNYTSHKLLHVFTSTDWKKTWTNNHVQMKQPQLYNQIVIRQAEFWVDNVQVFSTKDKASMLLSTTRSIKFPQISDIRALYEKPINLAEHVSVKKIIQVPNCM